MPSLGWASLSIPAGSSIDLNGGTLNLGESPLALGGSLDLGSGQIVGISDLTALPASLFAGGSGLIQLSGDWSVQGVFDAGTGAVRFVDAVSGMSNLRGSNVFHALSLISAIGKHVVLEPGSIQQINQQLEIQGTSALPIQIERLPGGDVAQMLLSAAGIQIISHVGVSDVYATGQPLAPTLTNEGGSGNAIGWFGTLPPPSLPLPVNSPFSLLALFGLILLAVRFGHRKNRFTQIRGN